MKKILSIVSIILVLSFALTSCGVVTPSPTTTESNTTTVTTTEPTPDGPKEDVVEIIDGYIWVNGVNTGIKAEQCNHVWQTVTTAPTCTAGGYDTITCKICDKSYTDNETEQLEHTYSTEYIIDDEYHWYKCVGCDDIKDKELHTLDDDGICIICENLVSATPGIVYDISTDGTYAEVIAYNGTATKVKIAEEYNGLPVKIICQRAFYDNNQITHLVIGNSVTTIGDYAFAFCDALTSVVIDDSVIKIGDNAFYYCNALTSIVIGNSVTTIGDSAFEYCYRLSSIVMPNFDIDIGYHAFYSCTNLITEYEYGKYVKVGDNPYAILIEITNKNMSTYNIHPDTKMIGYKVFVDCERLTSIIIPNSVISISNYAFYNCDALTSVEIGDSVTTIGDYAFYSCDALTSVVIGDSVTTISDYAFTFCFNLTVYYAGSEEEWKNIVLGVSAMHNPTLHFNYVPEE